LGTIESGPAAAVSGAACLAGLLLGWRAAAAGDGVAAFAGWSGLMITVWTGLLPDGGGIGDVIWSAAFCGCDGPPGVAEPGDGAPGRTGAAVAGEEAGGGCELAEGMAAELEITGIVVTTRGGGLADCTSTGVSLWVTS
jgi:hypothetical protein